MVIDYFATTRIVIGQVVNPWFSYSLWVLRCFNVMEPKYTLFYTVVEILFFSGFYLRITF